MDRNALLLYLQNVRDLEVAKYRINEILQSAKDGVNEQIRRLPKEPERYSYPEEKKIESPGCIGWILTIFFGFAFIVFVLSIILLIKDEEEGLGPLYFLTILFLIAFLGALYVSFLVPIGIRKKYEMECKAVEQANIEINRKAEVIRAQNEIETQRMEKEYKVFESDYNNELSKVNSLLNSFYSMNIISSQYRNLPAICYIYDYMSTSQASLEDTLIHEHMENGIQRLEGRLDIIIGKIEDVVFETRCMRQENRTAIEKQNAQNIEMLKKLSSIENNTEQAAQYAELSANYSKANAYLSLANYLKH